MTPAVTSQRNDADGILSGAGYLTHRSAPAHQACRNLVAGNLTAFLAAELNDPAVHDLFTLVLRNAGLLHSRGLFERALIGAFRQGWAYESWPGLTLQWLFSICDPDRLRATGDPLPGPGPFEVYRGGGRGAGLSWTRDPLVAAFFADLGGPPEIRKAFLPADQVRVYFASFARDVWMSHKSRSSPWLPWLGSHSDEFIAAADPGGVLLEPAVVLDLILRTRA